MTNFTATHKYSVGLFQVWHVGKQAYEVVDRRTGKTVGHAEHVSGALRLAERLSAAEKAVR